MSSQKIRRQFLNYFKTNGHAIIPSSPVIPHDDPTLLFTNAGMNQFKDVFLGKSVREYTRATSSQKCVRVGGKHNDLENVGHTSRHLTFFEMLGNFSFGSYFKKEAIDFAWHVTREVFGFDTEKVWATVFYEDQEAFDLWTRYLPQERIVRMGEKDNFWAMGDTGPCGPCSELLFDRGSSYGAARSPAEDIQGERYLEFWNLVFMQYNRDTTGRLDPLPNPCVDTGAGLERVVSLQLGVDSLFETDILRGIIAQVESLSKKTYNPKDSLAPAFRVIADHMRTLAFAIADGVQPSNTDRGYVLRKVLRRAVRYGRQLGFDRPFLGDVLPKLIELMGEDFPELSSSQNRICDILQTEEENFLRTLRRGGNLLNQIISTAQAHKHEISGEDAFKLKDTYGLPLEEILLLAKDAHLTVDLNRFEELEHEAKDRSRQARRTVEQKAIENLYAKIADTHGASEFLGYHQTQAEGVILALFKEDKEVHALHPGEEGMILLNRTPFYAEKGGQIGDQGVIESETATFSVLDCQSPFPDLTLHVGVMKEGELRRGETITAIVDPLRRQKIANNHTATHLLHWALQHVLGDHIRQAGSVVESSRLRFDFSHHKPLSREELERIEDLVNAKIRENLPVANYEIPYEEAQKHKEIKQFFGEKYGSSVRVVDISFSKELCGGTHTHHTGNIGYFKILKEGSIASGVRRIEATTGEEAEHFSRHREQEIDSLCSLLKSSPHQVLERVHALLEAQKNLQSQISGLQKQCLSSQLTSFTDKVEIIGKIPFLPLILETKDLKETADLILEKESSLVLLLFTKEENRCTALARVSKDLVAKGIHAHALIQTISSIIGGKGGGKPDSAQAGGTQPQQIPQAIEKAREWIEQQSRATI